MGGLGLNGLAIASLKGARPYGIDINESKFSQAANLGALECATSLDAFSDKELDLIIDFAGTQETVQNAISAVRPGGTVVLVGLASSTICITTTSLVTRNVSLKGSTSASIAELQEVLELLSSGSLTPMIEQIAFADLKVGLELLDSNKVANRLYVIP